MASTTKQLHQRKRSKKSKSDEWWTPDNVFEQLCKDHSFHPEIDVACTYKNCKCMTGLTDALKDDWNIKSLLYKKKKFGDVWCNPPNSELQNYLLRAYYEWKTFGMKIMMIVPANTMSSKAFWNAVEIPYRRGEKIMYEPIYKRITFLDNGKKPKFSARNAYIVVIWGKRRKIPNMLIK